MEKQGLLDKLADWLAEVYRTALVFWIFADLFTVALTINITEESEPSLSLRLSFLVLWLVTMGLLALFIGVLIASCKNWIIYLGSLAMAFWAWVAYVPELLAFISESSWVNLPIASVTVWGLAAICIGAGLIRHFLADSYS